MPLVTPDELSKVIGLPATDSGIISAAAAADEVVSGYLVADVDHSTHARDREAALSVAVDIYQSRSASGGQIVGLDYTPTPFRMGPALLSTVSGLLGLCLDQGSDAG